MIKKQLFIFFCIITGNTLFGQILQEVNRFSIGKEALWTVDGLNNIIIADKERVVKLDQKGNVLFEQSQKMFGRLDQIGLVNSLKLYGFSENQQLIHFYDNSLTSLDKSIDLSDYDLTNVSAVASSIQSDKIWAFDQVNSSLHLLSLKGMLQSQEIKNIGGVLNATSIIEIVEADNKLFLLDQLSGIFVFDLYGTLLDKISLAEIKWIQVYNEYIVVLLEGEFQFLSTRSKREPLVMKIMDTSADSFYLNDEWLYYRSGEQIIQMKIQL